MKAKFYRVFAWIFALMGMVMFCVTYFSRTEGDILKALHDPLLVFYILIPFLPAIVMVRLAAHAEKKLHDFLHEPCQNGGNEGHKA